MKTCIYQICYSQETLNNVPKGFHILDNTANERPDWREYWAIRNFLLSNYLAEDTLYGFFTPKFSSKTNLSYGDVQAFLSSNYKGEDIVSFSPFWDLMSIFKNVFEQGDFFHPGLSDACQLFSDQHLAGIDLKNCITHSRNTIFCNYFLAKKSFWEEWLKIGEILFEASENNNTASKKLRAETSYGEQSLPMKIFVQERLATICLLCNTTINSLNYSSFNIGASTTPFNKFLKESIISDALKRTYSQTKDECYLSEFAKLRNQIIEKLGNKNID